MIWSKQVRYWCKVGDSISWQEGVLEEKLDTIGDEAVSVT